MSAKKNKDQKEETNHIYVNSLGIAVHLKAISMFEMQAIQDGIEREYRERGEPIDPPFYEVELAGGAKQKHVLTADALVKEGDPIETAKRKLDWDSYQRTLNRAQREVNDIQMNILLEGIDVQLPEDDAWIKRCKRLHITIPDDEDERLDLYKRSQIVRTTDDLIEIQAIIMQISSGGAISPERMEAAKALFRSTIQKQAG